MNFKLRGVMLVAGIAVALIVAKTRQNRSATLQSEGQKWERDNNMTAPGDDPRFKAAEAEARRRWPEFVAEFNKHEPRVAYAVKAKFTEHDASEWMWVQVLSIDGDTVTGTLDNDPVDVHNVKLGDKVTKRLADLDDWIVGRNGGIAQGGFTSKVLEQIESERKGRK